MIDKGTDFMWYLYLEATKTESVPDVMFPHVEKVIQNGIQVGMALEVPLQNEPEEHYWVAKITMACGPLLELQYYGCDDKASRIWFNVSQDVAHELGWCYKNDKKLVPPKNCDIQPSIIDKLETYINHAVSVPSDMLSGGSINMMSRIKEGMKVEISDPLSPYRLWMATILENVGGRLLLRYDTPASQVKEFWMFCTSELIHDYGFAKSSSTPWFLDPPTSIKPKHSSDEWIDFVKSYLMNECPTSRLFSNEKTHSHHSFKVGMKLETISPGSTANFHPATVTFVFDETYFLVSVDESMKERDPEARNDAKKTWLCTVDHPYIFPINWAKKHSIKLVAPKGWINTGEFFDWDRYLKETNSSAAPECSFVKRENAAELGFETGMRLEAVDPQNKSHICAAQITKTIDDLLFIKLDSEDPRPDHVVHIYSAEIFPVGWCDTNQYPLRVPRDYKEVFRKHRSFKGGAPNSTGRTNLTKIYFNSRCSTGPMISKSKLTSLPKSVGPGPVDLVLKEVLTMLVSVGYNTARVLKVLQCDDGPLEPGYNIEMLKVKQKNNRYHASVAVVNDCEMVEEFCRNTCKKIMVCPNLFGPNYITEQDQCPEKCRKSRGRGKWIRKRGRQPNKDKNIAPEEPEGEREDDSSSDLSQHTPDDENKNVNSLKSSNKLLNCTDNKNDLITSDTSEGSNNDRIKRNGCDSSSIKSASSKETVSPTVKSKRKRVEEVTPCVEPEYEQKKTRRPKILRLVKNPIYWSVEEVYDYLCKTNDCKDLAQKIKKEEIDGMAFLLLNLPTLTQHLKLDQTDALKLCRHIEQVKVTFFLRHLNDPEPEM